MEFKDVVKFMTGCIFSISMGIGIFMLFAVIYESTHSKSGVQDISHDYVEVDTSDLKNIVIHGYNGYQAREEYLADRWQTEDGVIAVTIYFEEADDTK